MSHKINELYKLYIEKSIDPIRNKNVTSRRTIVILHELFFRQICPLKDETLYLNMSPSKQMKL